MFVPGKAESLRHWRTFHAAHRAVTDTLFQGSDFFDPRDLVQVKYEMLRRVRLERCPVRPTTRAFALSPASYYDALSHWQQQGLIGLLPSSSGPRRPHKLTPEVLAALDQILTAEGPLPAAELARRLRQQRGLCLHPRSIEKTLARRKKGGARRGHDPHPAPGTSVTRRRGPPGWPDGRTPGRTCCCGKGCWPGCAASPPPPPRCRRAKRSQPIRNWYIRSIAASSSACSSTSSSTATRRPAHDQRLPESSPRAPQA